MALAARHRSHLTALFTADMSHSQRTMVRASELGLASGADWGKATQAVQTEIEERAQSLQALPGRLRSEGDVIHDWLRARFLGRKSPPCLACSPLSASKPGTTAWWLSAMNKT